jgi:RHS repeat-associated protein
VGKPQGQIYFLRTLTWDDAGNLRTIGIYSHDYDGKNQRVRTRTPDGAETYTFTTANGLTLGEYGPTGSYTREYAYLGTQLIALIDHDTYGSERTSYLHPNALGSPVAATDPTGTLLWKETYQPYGERKQKQPNSTANNRWYTGHTEDPTGLVYAGARYYDPVIGRFISTDPVAFTEKNPHSFNRYSYANNNPYKYVDPDGRAGQLVIHSSGNGGSSMMSGHSWIVYTPDGGMPMTMGTWGNNPTGHGNGLFADLEQGRVGDATRGARMSDAQERNFLDKVRLYGERDEDAWKLSGPCSKFASDAWEAGTGESLNTRWGPVSNPTTLKESIFRKNGGANHGTLQQNDTDSNSNSGASSSSWSSGSSIDPLRSFLK